MSQTKKAPATVIKKWKEIEKGVDLVPPNRRFKDERGSLGTRIKLTTNHFEVEVTKKNLTLYQYDVTIKDHMGSEALPKKKKMSIFEKLKTSYPLVFSKVPLAYDSMKNAYSTVDIKQCKTHCKWEVSMKTEVSESKPEHETKKNNSTYSVKIAKTKQANLNNLFKSMQFSNEKQQIPTDIVQMIEVMFRHYRAKIYEQVSGRNFFSLSGEFDRPLPIGGGKEGVTGFFGSLRPAAWKNGSILLNLNMAHTAFYKEQLVVDFIKETMEIDDRFFVGPMSFSDATKVNKNLKGLKIRVTHAQRTYKVLKVNPLGADKIKFDYTDKKNQTKKVSVVEYMMLHYNIRLKYPRFNCLHVGNPDKNINIPIEMCMIDKGQRVLKKLSDKETASFIRSTAVPPGHRLRQIKEVARRNNFAQDEMLKALTFKISDVQPLQVDGRVLPTPDLNMKQNVKNFKPRDGVWDIRDKNFYMASELKTWTVINYDSYKTRMDTVQRFIRELVKMGRQKGMKINDPCDVYESRQQRNQDPNPLEDFTYYKDKYPDIQLIMCVIPGKKVYGAIKKAGDTEVKIITQCVVGTNVMKCQPQTIGNILLKINAKMDGTNNVVFGSPGVRPQYIEGLLQFKEPFMIMGADVNHPPAGEGSSPSLAAVVGSYNPFATKYALERRMQPPREEMIRDMTQITMNLLKNFYTQSRGRKPERIIMFRDGVSESQFAQVLSYEMLAMREACKKMPGGDYQPGITFICVQKRHHTRLFCDERDGIGKSKNVPPGTIVDHSITHPTETDFYLCSHQGIQGTSRPTHYHLLWDDNDFSVDDLQMLTYKLCHVYVRCARTVSIPAPVYYAHWAAYRAKLYVSELLGSGSDSGSSASGESGISSELMNKIRATVDVRIDPNNPLATRLHYI